MGGSWSGATQERGEGGAAGSGWELSATVPRKARQSPNRLAQWARRQRAELDG